MCRKWCWGCSRDINSIAVRNAKINALLNDIKIDIRKSDVFSNLKKSEKFDVIF